MKYVLIVTFFTCFALCTHGQIQFWNIADVEDGQWITGRKTGKLKLVMLYRNDEYGKRTDSTHPEELRHYNTNGQLTARIFYTYNWNSKSWNLQKADSFIYDAGGRLTAYRSFEGPYNKSAYETQVKYNSRKQPIRQDHYVFSGYERTTDSYDLFEYDAKGLPKKLTTYNADKTLNLTRQFSFNAAGKLVKTISSSAFGVITEIFSRGNKGELLSYQEMYENKPQKTISYTYDNLGRRVKKQTTTTSNYDEIINYTYDGSSQLLSKTYLQYSGSGGKNDRRHEYMEVDNRFFE